MSLRAQRWMGMAAALFAAETALGLLSFRVTLPPIGAPAFWLTNGLAIAVLVRGRLRSWAWLLPTIAAAHGLVFSLDGSPLPAVVLWTAGDLLEVTAAALLIRRFCGPATTLSRLRDVLVFAAAAAVVGPLTGGLLAGFSVPWLPGVTYRGFLESWWLTDGLGSFVTAPLVLAWTGPARARPTLRQTARTLLTVATLATALYLVFGLPDSALRLLLLAFGISPLLAWVALAHGPRGAATGAAAAGCIALWQTLGGHGPFGGLASLEYQLFAVQGFVALAGFTGLVVAALGEERRRASRSRTILLAAATALTEPRGLEERLRQLVAGLSGTLGAAAAVARLADGKLAPVATAATGEPASRELDALLLLLLHGPAPATDARHLVLPLAGEEGPLGVLLLVHGRGGLDPDDLALGKAVASRLSVVLEGEQLREQSAARLVRLEESLALLSRSEQRFRSLAQATAEIVGVTAADGSCHEPSPSWAAFTGQPAADSLGFGWLSAIHPDDRAHLLGGLAEAITRPAAVTMEYRLRRHDGAWRYVEARAAPVLDSGGRLREWVSMNFDITGRKEEEAERARLFAEAEEAIRMRDDFLSVASHELKTPLTPLSLRLQRLQRRLSEGRAIPPAEVDRALASLDRLTELINDLLDVSRVQAHRLALHFGPVSLSAIVQATLSLFEAAQHQLILKAPPEELWVLGDANRLDQVIANLVDNAVKYSPQGGEILLTLEAAGGEVRLSVQDHGIGIPLDQQARLFDRFFRARHPGPGFFQGLGLGLYISRDIVERHGGRIWVESEPGQGSTFFVALPTSSRPAVEEGAGAPAS